MDKQQLLNKFEKYVMNDLGYEFNTMKGYKYNLGLYLDWIIENELNYKKIDLNQTYDYIAYRRSVGDKDSTVARHKTSIKHFNQCIGKRTNPALLVQLSKQDRTTPTNLVEEEFMSTIYRETVANTLVQKRDRCILGMVLFLGLQRKELERMEVEHLDLEKMQLYVPKTTISNERYITLNPVQILHMSSYIYDIRPRLIVETKRVTNKLFFSYGDSNHLNGMLSRMLVNLKKEFHYIKSFKQLKQSRVTIWVKEHGLREAQYLGGYRYVTSLLRYDFKSMDSLKMQLQQLHPLEKMG